MDVDKTEAGREMDVLIEEIVFGLEVMRGYGPPYYSTDIAAAWEVVEHMARRGFWCRITSPFEAGDPYHAGFTPHSTTGWNGRPDFSASAETAPLAICRAALKAVAAD